LRTDRLPAALRIAQVLQGKVERQEYQPGEWLPTERELAAEFSADRATIRAAIAHLAQERLIVRQSGRRPWVNTQAGQTGNPTAQSPDQTTLKMIAAVIPQPPNYPTLALIQRGILRVLQKDNPLYRLIVFDNQGDTWSQSVTLERHALEAIEREGIAGAVLWQIGRHETLDAIQRLQEKGMPLVLLDRCPEELPCDFVGVDNYAAACEAVQYLIQLGHRRIGHLTGDEAVSTGRAREEGYLEALRSQGLTPSAELVFRLSKDRDDLYPDLRPAVDHFLALSEPPTALFAMKDLLAHAFITEVKARGMRVPEDISVIGFDDHDRHALQPPVLTTVHQPFERMGQRAAEILLRRLAQPSGSSLPNTHLLLPTPLVIRSTCAPPPHRNR
jgi:DNA-binding LacI/PurR family transcriptional regulator